MYSSAHDSIQQTVSFFGLSTFLLGSILIFTEYFFMLLFHFVFWDKSFRIFVWNHAVIEKIKSALCMFSNVIVVVEILFIQCTSLWLLFISRLLVSFHGKCGRNEHGTKIRVLFLISFVFETEYKNGPLSTILRIEVTY